MTPPEERIHKGSSVFRAQSCVQDEIGCCVNDDQKICNVSEDADEIRLRFFVVDERLVDQNYGGG